jgi:hypothetical protein
MVFTKKLMWVCKNSESDADFKTVNKSKKSLMSYVLHPNIHALFGLIFFFYNNLLSQSRPTNLETYLFKTGPYHCRVKSEELGD